MDFRMKSAWRLWRGCHTETNGIRQPENGKSAIVGRFSGSLQGRDGATVVVFWLHIIFHKFTACKPK